MSDLNIISALGITTCYEAYFRLDPSDELARYCMEFFSTTQIREEIEDTNATFLIAEEEGRAIGYAKLREGKKVECLDGREAIEIQRIYLLEKLKGKGYGRQLIAECEKIAKAKGYGMTWLGVWDKNLDAISFYEKAGYERIGETDFSDGKNSFINLVMGKSLNEKKTS